MKFIMLTKIEGDQIAVNVNSICSIEAANEDETWVELTNGSKLMVSHLAEEILDAIHAVFVIMKSPVE